MKKYILSLLSLLVFAQAHGQVQRCHSTEALQQRMLEDPTLEQRLQQQKLWLQQLEMDDDFSAGQRQTIIIPVVVHIVYNTSTQNISDAQISSQIEVLNEDFRRLNADTTNTPSAFLGVAADSEIEFCLAQVDPNGNFTTGITRTQTNTTTFTTDDKIMFTSSGGRDAWPSNQYLNIWVGNLTGGILGYAYPPNAVNPARDGVVIKSDHFGRTGNLSPPFNRGRTATHEIGHWLGLDHVWGTGGCVSDDLISDTPLQNQEYYGCPVFPQSSCGTQDMFMNYMDYTNDNCMNLFTQGQRTRMRNVLNNIRTGILNTLNCYYISPYNFDISVTEIVTPENSICALSFTPVVRMKNEGNNEITSVLIRYEVDGILHGPILWTGSLTINQSVLVNLPPVAVTSGTHVFKIFVQEPNGEADENTVNNSLTRNFNVNPVPPKHNLPYAQNFENLTFPPTNWSLNNPDNDRKWEEGTAVGGFSQSLTSAIFDNFTSLPNPIGRRDGLITPSVDFRDIAYPLLEFDVAYARRNPSAFDSLIVYYTINCGETWWRVYQKGSTGLATATDQTIIFFPEDNEWRRELIDINYLSGNSNVQFKFENYSGRGNQLYIDNVQIRSAGVGVEEFIHEKPVLYPNPASDHVHVRFPDKITEEIEYKLLNTLGQIVQQGKCTSGCQLDLSGLNPGIYFFSAKAGDGGFSPVRLVKSR